MGRDDQKLEGSSFLLKFQYASVCGAFLAGSGYTPNTCKFAHTCARIRAECSPIPAGEYGIHPPQHGRVCPNVFFHPVAISPSANCASGVAGIRRCLHFAHIAHTAQAFQPALFVEERFHIVRDNPVSRCK